MGPTSLIFLGVAMEAIKGTSVLVDKGFKKLGKSLYDFDTTMKNAAERKFLRARKNKELRSLIKQGKSILKQEEFTEENVVIWRRWFIKTRDALNMTFTDMSHDFKVSTSMINNWEVGIFKPTKEVKNRTVVKMIEEARRQIKGKKIKRFN